MHDMDLVKCPRCGGQTIRGMVEMIGRCANCCKIDYLAKKEQKND